MKGGHFMPLAKRYTVCFIEIECKDQENKILLIDRDCKKMISVLENGLELVELLKKVKPHFVVS
jgi:hypothetical protein